MIRIDITDIEFPDDSFDVIICNHVLEHIPDDREAMKELARVLSYEGFGVITVPVTTDVTFEDASVINPVERERLFGQGDHVRRYGKDFVSRLEKNGFEVITYHTEDIARVTRCISLDCRIMSQFSIVESPGSVFR